jgi:alpha-amylase
MKAVCICLGVNLPYSPKWYWPAEGFSGVPEIDRYFDRKSIFYKFKYTDGQILRLNELLMESVEKEGVYSFDLSGPFLEQCRWDPELLESFLELEESENIEFTGSCYNHSLSSLYPDLSWFQEEVLQYREMIREVLGVIPETFVNTQLLYTGRVGHILADMGYRCQIVEGSKNLLSGSEPVHVFNNQLPTLLRHINLSEDLELRFSEQKWKEYPLTPEKLADWISKMEGDVLTLYFNYTGLCGHYEKTRTIADFIRNLPGVLKAHGIKMLTPVEAVEKFTPFQLPALRTEQTIRYGMQNAVGNHAQQLYLRELVRVGEELSELKGSKHYWKLKQLFGYLQQGEIFFSMNPGGIRDGYERAVNYFSILSDFSRAVLEERV